MNPFFRTAASVAFVLMIGCSDASMSFLIRDNPEKPKPPASVTALILMNRHQAVAVLSDIFGVGAAASSALTHKVQYRGSVLGGGCDVHAAIRLADGTPLDPSDLCLWGMEETRYPTEGYANTLSAGFISHACELITNDLDSIRAAVEQVPGTDWTQLAPPGIAEIQALWSLFYPGAAPEPEVMTRLQAVSTAVAGEPPSNMPEHQYQALLLTICLTGAWLVL